MKEEKKAEEYAIENLPDGYTKINYMKKRAYLDGLVEGRKELFGKTEQLEKENEKLKAENAINKDLAYALIEIMYDHENKDFRDEVSLESYVVQTMEKIKDTRQQDVEYAIFDKPKWHDLRKDPNDLPEGDEDCLCFISKCYFVGHYAREDEEWHFDEFISNKVSAWCEIQKFEE